MTDTLVNGILSGLVERFQRNLEAYKSPQYNLVESTAIRNPILVLHS